MKKALSYRLFGFGAIPAKLRPVLDAEEIIAADEGMRGWFLAGNVKGPAKRYCKRAEGFSGCLAVTKKRIICCTYRRLQINLVLDDPKIAELCVLTSGRETLSISFESSVFREGWAGGIEFRFKTDKAQRFHDVLKASGAR